jgi:hypothetical protein
LKITLDKPEGRRRVGRSNLRWMGGVTKDAERLGVRNWRIKARDRDGWRRLLASAKTLHELQRLGGWMDMRYIKLIPPIPSLNYRIYVVSLRFVI